MVRTFRKAFGVDAQDIGSMLTRPVRRNAFGRDAFRVARVSSRQLRPQTTKENAHAQKEARVSF